MSSLHPLARSVDHPAPLRGSASSLVVLTGLFAAPAAWSMQLIVSYALIGDRCAAPLTVMGKAILFIAGVLAIAATLIGLVAAYRTWTQTRHEGPGGYHEGLTAGAGRTRFLGLCGLVASSIFALAAVFEMLVPFLGTSCPLG